MCDNLPNTLPGALLPEGFCAQVVDSSLDRPRAMVITPGGEILVVERGMDRVVSIVDNDGDLIADEKVVIAQAPSIRHGIAVNNGHLYASSSSTVYRWNYTDGQRTESLSREVVVKNINAQSCDDCGAPEGHSTRTLVFDTAGLLYVSVGSVSNVDADSYRSRIRRFNLTDVPAGGFEFDLGEVFADGLRNEVGLAFDRSGVLWGVENGADNLYRSDLGGDIHNENPAEELNRFPEENAGKHYGYPYCFSEFNLPEAVSLGKTSQWAWPSFMSQGYTDEWCRMNSTPATLAMQAHASPLGITFFDTNMSTNATCSTGGSFPASFDRSAFVFFHGSWNRDIPTGYKVAHIPFGEDLMPASTVTMDFMCSTQKGAKWENGLRPVDGAFDKCNRLYVTSDGTKAGSTYIGDMLLVITYHGTDSNPSLAELTTSCDESAVPDVGLIVGISVAVFVVTCVAMFLIRKEQLRRRDLEKS